MFRAVVLFHDRAETAEQCEGRIAALQPQAVESRKSPERNLVSAALHPLPEVVLNGVLTFLPPQRSATGKPGATETLPVRDPQRRAASAAAGSWRMRMCCLWRRGGT